MIEYRPLLHDKQAEMHSLASLSPQTRVKVSPIIQIRHPARPDSPRKQWSPNSAVLDAVSDPNDGILGCWGCDQSIGVDLRLLKLHEFERPPIESVFDQCRDLGIKAVPVTGRGQPTELRMAAAQAAQRLGFGSCIRVVKDELGIGTTGLRGVLNELDMPRSSIDLVLDLGNIPSTDVFLLAGVVSTCVSKFAPYSEWRSVSVISTSFPTSLSEIVEHNSFNMIKRGEHTLWTQVGQNGAEGTPIFGDYGIVCANQPPGFRGAANLRYTVSDSWYVLRGEDPNLATSADYLRLAGILHDSDFWRGSDHCAGCTFIEDRLHDGKPGNATQWREAGFAHHFAVICDI